MKQVVLKSYPKGEPKSSDFALEEVADPECPDGGILLRTIILSLDPLIRFTIDETPLTSPYQVPIGGCMYGGAVSEVIESKNDDYAVGDIVDGRTGWRELAAVDPAQMPLRKVDGSIRPRSAALGVLGGPGMTAYAGMVNTAKVKAGDTVVVSAAAGAVGSIAGQIAKIHGARVIGIAGGAAKAAQLETIGFDKGVDYKAADYAEQLAAAVPDGVDVYFENVGGAVTEAVMPLFNRYARMPMCGYIAYYGVGMEGPGPNKLPGLYRTIMSKALEIKGFSGMMDAGPDAMPALKAWVDEGKLVSPEHIAEGLENAAEAFAGMFAGNDYFGKLLVRVGED